MAAGLQFPEVRVVRPAVGRGEQGLSVRRRDACHAARRFPDLARLGEPGCHLLGRQGEPRGPRLARHRRGGCGGMPRSARGRPHRRVEDRLPDADLPAVEGHGEQQVPVGGQGPVEWRGSGTREIEFLGVQPVQGVAVPEVDGTAGTAGRRGQQQTTIGQRRPSDCDGAAANRGRALGDEFPVLFPPDVHLVVVGAGEDELPVGPAPVGDRVHGASRAGGGNVQGPPGARVPDTQIPVAEAARGQPGLPVGPGRPGHAVDV